MTEAKGFRRPSRIFRGRCSRAPRVQAACYRRSGLTDRVYDLSSGLFPGLDAALEDSGIEPELAETRRGATADAVSVDDIEISFRTRFRSYWSVGTSRSSSSNQLSTMTISSGSVSATGCSIANRCPSRETS